MHLRSSGLLAVLSPLLVLAGSCRRHEDATETVSKTVAVATPEAGAPALVLPSTTSPVIAIGNLDGEIDAARAHPPVVALIPHAIDNLLLRGQFLGRIADYEAADAASVRLLTLDDGAAAHLTRARVLESMHLFAEATREVDRAGALGASAYETGRARVPIWMALGRCEDAAKLAGTGYDALSLELASRGALEQQRGHAVESEKLFSLARARFRDVSPFGAAWMDFERARAFEREGDRAKAIEYFEEATTILPEYAHAVLHLAATEPPERALQLLAATERSDDPDVLAARADALRRAGKTQEAADALAKARARFEEVLAKHPEAYADHAASFFLGMGKDAVRALALAKRAATAAPSETALDAWLTAAQAVGSREETCAASAKASSIQCVLGPSVRERFAAAARTCR